MSMKLMAAAAALAGGSPQDVFIATSDFIDVARAAAAEWEGRPADPKVAVFDIVDPALDKLPGYTSVIYYVNDRPRLSISINLKTGQIVDRGRCVYFKGAPVIRFGQRIRQLTKAAAIPWQTLANQLGCQKLAPDR
ncbi:MAG: hypothetical protein V4610_15605 [Pseudomonadota bacterium]|jgi:hypothetical protein